jgi:hypothetical protein
VKERRREIHLSEHKKTAGGETQVSRTVVSFFAGFCSCFFCCFIEDGEKMKILFTNRKKFDLVYWRNKIENRNVHQMLRCGLECDFFSDLGVVIVVVNPSVKK